MDFTEDGLPDKPLVTGQVAIDIQGNITGIAGGWEAIKIAQKVFQKKHCAACGHYNQQKRDFKEKGHLGTNDPNDCKHHWTDYLGQCHNFHPAD